MQTLGKKLEVSDTSFILSYEGHTILLIKSVDKEIITGKIFDTTKGDCLVFVML